jgi:hypothetical protein
MVAIAPPSRDAWPATPNGDTVSPTSARFLITTPSNGARTLVFSSASSATRTRARADAIAASADLTRAADTAAADCAPVNAASVVMPSFISARWRSKLRLSSSRAAIACASCASISATARRDASSCASTSACSISAITSPLRTRVPSSNCSRAMRPPVFTPTSLLCRATTYPVATSTGRSEDPPATVPTCVARAVSTSGACRSARYARPRGYAATPAAHSTATTAQASHGRRGGASRSMRRRDRSSAGEEE